MIDKQAIKVIGLDMDGTLLKDDKTISEFTESVLKRAIEQGIHILPATGRVKIGIPECIRNMECVRYGICSNGASVLDLATGEELYSCRISNEDAMKMIEAGASRLGCRWRNISRRISPCIRVPIT